MEILRKDKKNDFASKTLVCVLIILFIILQRGAATQISSYILNANSTDFNEEIPSDITWGEVELLSNPENGRAFDPGIVVDGRKNIHVVWQRDLEIFYTKYNNLKKEWSEPIQISEENTDILASYPEITCNKKGIIHVIWRATGPAIIHRWFDGKVWSNITRIPTNNLIRSHDVITDSFGNAYIVWSDKNPSEWDNVVCTIFNKTTISWKPVFHLIESEKNSNCVALAIDSEEIVHMVWTDILGNDSIRNVYYQQFKGNLFLLDTPVKVNDEYIANPYAPKITVNAQNVVYIVWEGKIDNSLDGILFRALKDNRFITETKKISGNNVAYYPSICCDSKGQIHISWNEIGNLMYKSLNAQLEWSETLQLTFNNSYVEYTQINADKSGIVHIVWSDYTIKDSWQVYYVKGVAPKEGILISILIPSIGAVILFSIVTLIVTRKKDEKNQNAYKRYHLKEYFQLKTMTIK